MEREFPWVLSVSRMLQKHRQPRNLCVFECRNSDATDNATLIVRPNNQPSGLKKQLVHALIAPESARVIGAEIFSPYVLFMDTVTRRTEIFGS